MNYEYYASLARKLISDKGSVCVLQSDKREYSKELHDYVITSEKTKAYGVYSFYDEKVVDGTTIRQGDVDIILAIDVNMDRKPQKGDRIVFKTEEFNVIHAKKIAPDGATVIMYRVQGRN